MVDDQRTAKRLKTAARARRPVYSGIDDDEFTDGVAMGPGAKRAILTHYDDVREQRGEIVLTEGGGARADANNLEGGGGDSDEAPLPQSLRVNKTDVVEYYTNEEMGNFRKPKKVRKKRSFENISSITRMTWVRVRSQRALKGPTMDHVFTVVTLRNLAKLQWP